MQRFRLFIMILRASSLRSGGSFSHLLFRYFLYI
nr:MAG TPA: hypothetical protein [Caudoviricetes sp.]